MRLKANNRQRDQGACAPGLSEFPKLLSQAITGVAMGIPGPGVETYGCRSVAFAASWLAVGSGSVRCREMRPGARQRPSGSSAGSGNREFLFCPPRRAAPRSPSSRAGQPPETSPAGANLPGACPASRHPPKNPPGRCASRRGAPPSGSCCSPSPSPPSRFRPSLRRRMHVVPRAPSPVAPPESNGRSPRARPLARPRRRAATIR